MNLLRQANPWRGLEGLPEHMWILSIATFINRLGTMAWPFLALYGTQRLGLATSQAGLLLTAYGVACFIAAPFTGTLSDAFGPVRMMMASLFGAAAILAVYPLVHTFAALIVLTVIWAIFAEAFRPAAMAMVADLVTPQNRKAAFALNRLAINLGMSVGPALGGFLLLISYDFLFWIDGATSLVAGLVIAFSSLTRIHHREEDSHARGVQVHAFKDRALLIFLLASIPVWAVFFLHEGPMPLFLVQELKLPESDYGLLFTVNTSLIIFFEVPLNLRMANQPHARTLGLGALLIGVGFGCTQFATGFWSAALTVSLWTVGEMIMLPTSATFVADIAPAKQRGQYMALYQMMSVLALSLSTWLGTWTFERFGSAVVWGGAFGCGLLSAILFYSMKGADTVGREPTRR